MGRGGTDYKTLDMLKTAVGDSLINIEFYLNLLASTDHVKKDIRRLTANPDVISLWTQIWGTEQLYVSNARFAEVLHVRGYCTPSEANAVVEIADSDRTGEISPFKFESLLELFGPLRELRTNLEKVINQPWYCGRMTKTATVKALNSSPPGTFLVRFSESEAFQLGRCT
jgi:SH2 domain